MLSAETSLVMQFNNDIYSQYTCQPQSCFNTLKGTVICPATAKHLDKFSAQNVHFVYETPAEYKSITLPFIEEQSFSIQVCLKCGQKGYYGCLKVYLPTFPEWNVWDFWISEDVQTISKDIWRFPNVNEELVSSSTMRSDMVWRIQTRHIALFIGLCFFVLVRVYIFFESVSVKDVIAQIFQPGMRNWSYKRELAWDRRFRSAGMTPKAWELAVIWKSFTSTMESADYFCFPEELNLGRLCS